MRLDTDEHQDTAVRKEKLGRKRVTVVRDGMIKWKSLSKGGDRFENTPWLGVVMDYDEEEYEYNWEINFLENEVINNEVYVEVDEVYQGDMIRVSGKHYQCYYVEKVSEDLLVCREIKDLDARDIAKRRNMKEKQKYIDMIDEMLHEMDAEEVKELADETGAIKRNVAKEL